jgi:hypothetical protein
VPSIRANSELFLREIKRALAKAELADAMTIGFLDQRNLDVRDQCYVFVPATKYPQAFNLGREDHHNDERDTRLVQHYLKKNQFAHTIPINIFISAMTDNTSINYRHNTTHMHTVVHNSETIVIPRYQQFVLLFCLALAVDSFSALEHAMLKAILSGGTSRSVI